MKLEKGLPLLCHWAGSLDEDFKERTGTFLVVQWLRLHFRHRDAGVRELRAHRPQGEKEI